MKAALVIPALNEEDSIGPLLEKVPNNLFATVVVADNGSTDRTAREAEARGALVTSEPRQGYGSACLRALQAISADIDAVVFMDGDGSDDPAEAERLLDPIHEGVADLVIGSRVLGRGEAGSLPAHQRLGNRIATGLLTMILGHHYTDLGPYRAIRADCLRELGMREQGFGWTVEMQIKAVRNGLRVVEVPVSRRVRFAGHSKVGGTVRGSIAAGCKILWMVARGAASTTN